MKKKIIVVAIVIAFITGTITSSTFVSAAVSQCSEQKLPSPKVIWSAICALQEKTNSLEQRVSNLESRVNILEGSPPAPVMTSNVIIAQGAGSGQECVTNLTCYQPDSVALTESGTVTWTNNDAVGHTVTSGSPADNQTGTVFDSSLISAGKTYSFTFQNAGDYHYFCQVHPWMTGEVVVGASGTLTVQTDKTVYQIGQLVQVLGKALPNTIVSSVMTSPSGKTYTATVSSDSGGSYSMFFSPLQPYEVGKWSISVSNLGQTAIVFVTIVN